MLNGPGVGIPAFIVAFVSASPLYLASRAWRLPWWLTLLVGSLPLSVCVVALIHWEPFNLSQATRLGYGVVLFLGATAWASTAMRRLALAIGMTVIGILVAMASIAGWVVGGDPLDVMSGTLGWHNQTAIVLVAAYALATAMTLLGGGGLAAYGTVTAGLTLTGVVLTSSRFGLALVAVPAVIGLVVAALRARRTLGGQPRSMAPLVRWAASSVGALVLTLVLRSPLLFARGDGTLNPAAGLIERGGLDGSFESRMSFWRAALGMGLDHPIAGGGLWSFARQGVCYSDRPVMWHPHSEWLYAWAQGGLIGLLPLLAVLVVGIVVLVVRSLRPVEGVPSLLSEPVRAGALVALVLSVAHLTTEYDLSYLPLLGSISLLGAVVAAPHLGGPQPRCRETSTIVALAVVVAVVAISAVAVAVDPRAEYFPWTGPLTTVCGALG